LGRVKVPRKLAKSGDTSRVQTNSARGSCPNAYLFCDKKTGAAKFSVDANLNGDPPLDRIAGSLAVYCVAHYCSPADLVMVVRVDEALNDDIAARATALLESAHVSASSVALSPREREVLRAVANNLCNKEIAFQLSISVRTVKFHVSALLAKFSVSSRAQLCDFSAARSSDPSHADSNVKAASAISSGGTHGNNCK
jgi:DNA-binding CsgD family transcriptional regulator